MIDRSCAMLALLLLAAAPAAAQLPDKFENLRVLPKDIEQRALIEIMKGFTGALGVRCQHCHVGEEGMPLSEFDFASDEKPAKSVAREMIRMTREINATFLPRTGREPAQLVEVGCVTCHRGQTRPRMLDDVIAETAAEGGPEAALERYQALRADHYGSFTYDFSERGLRRTVERLVADGHAGAALVLAERMVEEHPDSALAHYMLAELHAAGGDREAAIKHYERALALRPDNPLAKQKIEALRKDQ